MRELPDGAADAEDGAVRPLLGERAQQRLRPLARGLLSVEGLLGVVVVGVMALVLIAQVAARNLLPFSIIWASEVARLALIWMTMLGVAYAVGRGIHLTVTATTDALPAWVRVWFQRSALVLIVVVGVLLCSSSYQLMERIGGVGASTSGIPRSVFFLASVVGYGLAALQAVLVLLIGPVAGPDELLDDVSGPPEGPLSSGGTGS